jgi:hypothetical protein
MREWCFSDSLNRSYLIEWDDGGTNDREKLPAEIREKRPVMGISQATSVLPERVYGNKRGLPESRGAQKLAMLREGE